MDNLEKAISIAHKMGRQSLAYAQLLFYAWAVKNGVDISPELVAGVSGVAAIYAGVKGKGQAAQ